jgi:hypothetical protein
MQANCFCLQDLKRYGALCQRNEKNDTENKSSFLTSILCDADKVSFCHVNTWIEGLQQVKLGFIVDR